MKIVPSVAGLLLAATVATPAAAGPSKGEILTLCKSEVKTAFEDATRIRTSRFKHSASATAITFKVSVADTAPQKVTCSFRDGIASLDGAQGKLASADKEVVQSGS